MADHAVKNVTVLTNIRADDVHRNVVHRNVVSTTSHGQALKRPGVTSQDCSMADAVQRKDQRQTYAPRLVDLAGPRDSSHVDGLKNADFKRLCRGLRIGS